MIVRDKCIVCGGQNLYRALDLGVMPSANDLVGKSELKKVKSYPLIYYWCKSCSLLQQRTLIEREKLFGNNYAYMTGVNKETVNLYTEEAKMLGKKIKIKDFAVVIASNDGTEIGLIKKFARFKKVIGIEPAKNVAKFAIDHKLPTINDFFSYSLSEKISKKYGKADLIVANNVFAHIPDPDDVLEGMRNLIKPSGLIEIEVHWFKFLAEKLQIDILYAEHYYEWTLKAMQCISRKHGLMVVEAESLPEQQGGSIRFWLSKSSAETKSTLEVIKNEEAKAGIYSLNKIKKLQGQANARKIKFIKLISKLNRQNKKIAIWSVPAKIVTLINFCDLSHKEIPFAYEVAPTKIDRVIPKANIMIKSEAEIAKDMPNYLIIGAWNYLDFAKKKLGWYLKAGGKLINPLTSEVISEN